jgi:adenylate cyclase class 2
MYEVEVKVPADLAAVAAALEDAGATELGAVEQTDTYYDAPHRDFAARDEALRLREERDEAGVDVAMTYKGPLVENASKTRRELETGVEDGAVMAAMLEALGFSPAATVEKRRRRYELEGFVVTLDEVTGLGDFVEIEAEATEDAIEPTRERAVAILENLGLDPAEQIRASYLELLLEDE